MTALLYLSSWWKGHGTKLICSAIGIIEAAREIPGIIPDDMQKWAALAVVVLAGGGIRRGFTNGKASASVTLTQ